MLAVTIKEEAMNLKESGEEHMGTVGQTKGKGDVL